MRSRSVSLVLVVLLLLVVSSLEAGATPTSHLGPTPTSARASDPSPTPLRGPSPSPTLASGRPERGGGGPSEESAVASSAPATILDRAMAQGVDPHYIFLPRPYSASAQVGLAGTANFVTPPYTSGPAPMGLAEYGLRNASNGSVVPYTLNTTRLVGAVSESGPGIVPFYLFGGAPDSYAIQLDAVTTNVTLFGQPGYQFWTQTVLEYSVERHLLTVISNVWNFSAPGAVDTGNMLAAHGPNGHLLANDLYYAEESFSGVRGPFDARLYLNSSVNASRDEIDFGIVLSGPSGTLNEPFDYVVFNSTANTTARFSNPSNFTANGFDYDPVGLTNDFELDVGGPGDGLQTNLYAASANLSLEYWDGSAAAYKTVPSAESFGGDAGETASGACVAWVQSPGGPFGSTTYGVMSSGPALLHGLWNASTPAGADPVTENVTPTNAWIFMELEPTWGETNFSVVESEWAPTEMNGGSFLLSPGMYSLQIFESGFDLQDWDLGTNPGGPPFITNITLVANPSEGVYAPLYVWNNDQFAAISTSGSGTPSDPYVLLNAQSAPFASVFGSLNDFDYPVFAGVLFTDTTSSVELLDPPSFATATPFPAPSTCSPEISCLPDTNALQYEFDNVSNVAIVDAANISGWFGTGHGVFASLFPTLATDTMVFWNSSHDLVAGNRFDLAAAGGVYLFGGGSNTIWGNIFRQGPAPDASPGALWPSFYGIGVQETESHDLLYNNAFDNRAAGVTAWTPTLDPYLGTFKTWADSWNVTEQPASDVNHASGFPYLALKGSVVGTTFQGGSYWWDYGTAANPLPSLPYDASGYITVGGDYYPLVPQYSVNFTRTGLPPDTPWSVTLNGMTEESTNASIFFSYQDVLDSASYSIGAVPGYVASPSSGSLVLNLTYTTNVTIRFSPDQGTLAGTVAPTNATVEIDGAKVPVEPNGSFSSVLPTGSHAVEATAPGYYPYYNNVTISYNTTTSLSIVLNPIYPTGPNGTLSLTVLPVNATIKVDGAPIVLTSGAYATSVRPGVYAIVGTAPGYYDYFNNLSVYAGATSTLAVRLNPVSPVGPNGTLALTVSPKNATVRVDGTTVTLSNGVADVPVAPGLRSIAASAPGYYPYFNNVTVLSGEVLPINLTLDPVVPPIGPDGTLAISIGTTGASLWVDGASTSLTTNQYSGNLPPGVHSVEVAAGGYYTYYDNVTVASGKTTYLSVTLDPVTAAAASQTGIGDTGWVIIGGLAAIAFIFFLTTIVLARRGEAARAAAAPPPPPPPPGAPPPAS